jgi:hypothetical protein
VLPDRPQTLSTTAGARLRLSATNLANAGEATAPPVVLAACRLGDSTTRSRGRHDRVVSLRRHICCSGKSEASRTWRLTHGSAPITDEPTNRWRCWGGDPAQSVLSGPLLSAQWPYLALQRSEANSRIKDRHATTASAQDSRGSLGQADRLEDAEWKVPELLALGPRLTQKLARFMNPGPATRCGSPASRSPAVVDHVGWPTLRNDSQGMVCRPL